MSAAYEALAGLAERERAFAEAGDLDALVALAAERAAVVAALPAQAPASARGALERAARAQEAATAALRAATEAVRRELAAVPRSHAAARAYAVQGDAGGAGGTLKFSA